MARIYVGTCSWAQHAPFYPEGLPKNKQIQYYAKFFPIVEVDSSFYTLIAERNFQLWAERTPSGFAFDVKPYRVLTLHERDTMPDPLTFEQFRASLKPLREAKKLRALTFQFPSWFIYAPETLEYLQRIRDEFPDDYISVEFRHESWLNIEHLPAVLDFLRERHLGLTVVDEPRVGSGSVPTVLAVTTPELTIVRFHGRNVKTWYRKGETSAERFDYLYDEEELKGWVPNVAELTREAKEVHLLFNNNRANYAVQNARMLTGLLQDMLPQQEIVLPSLEGEESEPPRLF